MKTTRPISYSGKTIHHTPTVPYFCFFLFKQKQMSSMTALQIYYDHWGRENNRLRKHQYVLHHTKVLLSKIFHYLVLEEDHDPRMTDDTWPFKWKWGHLDPNDKDFWYWMKFVQKELEESPRSRDPHPMELVANLLFPAQCPVILKRDQVGSAWEHMYTRRRRLCRQNGLEIRRVLNHPMDSLSRVDALVALPLLY
jgi:hypothetical protein